MKPEKLYQELKDLAEKIGIHVSEQNFRITTGIRVKSGFCKVKDQDYCIIDKHLKLNKKIETLAECLTENAAEAIETVFMIPAIREYMERFGGIKPKHHGGVGDSPEAGEQDTI